MPGVVPGWLIHDIGYYDIGYEIGSQAELIASGYTNPAGVAGFVHLERCRGMVVRYDATMVIAAVA